MLENVAQLGSAARPVGRTLQVLVDLDVGGGRTGVVDDDSAVALARRIQDTDGLQFAGLQAYKGLGSITDFVARREAWLVRASGIAKAVARLDAEGLHPRIVSGGGTGSHDFEHEAGVLTEIQAGTYVFMDVNYLGNELRRDEPHPFQPALTVRTRVISAVQPGFVVTDAGTKEIDGYRGPIAPVVLAAEPGSTRYSLVGDDLGRIDFLDPAGVFRSGPPSRSCRLSASRPSLSTPFTTAWPGTSSWTFGRSRHLELVTARSVEPNVPRPPTLKLLDNFGELPTFLPGRLGIDSARDIGGEIWRNRTRQPRPQCRTGESDKGLKPNAVGLAAVLSQSLANVGPTIGILFVTGLVVSKAGASAPFDFILVTVGLGFTAWSVAVLCRYMPSASVLYAGPARAFGGNRASNRSRPVPDLYARDGRDGNVCERSPPGFHLPTRGYINTMVVILIFILAVTQFSAGWGSI